MRVPRREAAPFAPRHFEGSLDAAALGRYLRGLLDLPDHSLRGRLQAYAQDHDVVLPPRVYQPF